MESTSKVGLDAATLGPLCLRHLGQNLIASREINDGWFNTIHVLTLEDGTRAVLKVSPPSTFQAMRYERDIMATEVAVHRRLAAESLLVPRILVDRPSGDEFIGHPWFIMDYLEGEALNKLKRGLGRRVRDSLDALVARQAAAVNRISGSRFGRWKEDGTSSPSWPGSLLAMVDEVLADARDKSLHLPLPEARIRAIFEAGRPALSEVTVPRLVLWDLHDGNVIAKTSPLSLVGFIDTDRALWGDPLMEYYFRKLGRTGKAWYRAYRDAWTEAGLHHPASGEFVESRLALYEAYLAIVLLTECAFRGYSRVHETWVRLYCARSLKAGERILRGRHHAQ